MPQDLAEAGFHVLQNRFSENVGNSLNSICPPLLLNLHARMPPFCSFQNIYFQKLKFLYTYWRFNNKNHLKLTNLNVYW